MGAADWGRSRRDRGLGYRRRRSHHALVAGEQVGQPSGFFHLVFSLTDPMFLNPVQDQKTEFLPQTF